MQDPATLELYIHSYGEDRFIIQPRFFESGDEKGRLLHHLHETLECPIDFVRLRECSSNPEAYGKALSAMVFHDRRVGEALAVARASAVGAEVPLRIRIRFAPSDAKLHAVIWELLYDSEAAHVFSTQERVLFSRYFEPMGGFATASEALPARPRVLVVVANPKRFGQETFDPFDVEAEVARAQRAFEDTTLRLIRATQEDGPATWERLVEQLRVGVDVLYLVCHGSIPSGEHETYLWLENRNGEPERIAGQRLVSELQALSPGVRLVVLTACRSAGINETNDTILAALAPRIVAAGCPAVVASQGDLSISTAQAFFPVFFSFLREHGQIERAMAAARAVCLNRRDWWRPLLFSQLRDGYLWRPDQPHSPWSNVPQQPAYYATREQDELKIVAFLTNQVRRLEIMNVYGLPGTGKTALVTAVLNRLRENRIAGDLVLWGDLGRHTPAEQLWAFMHAINGPRTNIEHAYLLHRDFWKEVTARFRRPLIVLDNVTDERQVAQLLPENSDWYRIVLISSAPLGSTPKYAVAPLRISGLDDIPAEKLFVSVLGQHYAMQHRQALLEICRMRGGMPQLLLVDAMHMLHASTPADLYRAELEQKEREIRADERAHHDAFDTAFGVLSPPQLQLLELGSLFAEGSWSVELLAAAALCSVSEAEAALGDLVKRGFLADIGNRRYTLNSLVRKHARARLECRPGREAITAKYLFARACLDLLNDRYEAIIANPAAFQTDEPHVQPFVGRTLVRGLNDTMLAEIAHIRESLILATLYPTWRLLERFARLAWNGLLDDVVANTPEISATLTLATLRRPVFWYAGSHIQVRGRAALVSQTVRWQGFGAAGGLEAHDAYQYAVGDRLVWPSRYKGFVREAGHRSELMLHLVACQIVEGIICGYSFIESRWVGVVAERLVLRGVDLVAAAWKNCRLVESLWLCCDARQVDLEGSSLAGAVLEQVRMRGANLRGANLRGALLVQVDLRGADLTNADLRGAELREVNARGATLNGALFDGATFEQVNFYDCKMDGCTWRGIHGEPDIDRPDRLEMITRQATQAPQLPALPERRLRPTARTLIEHPFDDYKRADLRGIDLAHASIPPALPERFALDNADLSAANLHKAALPMALLRAATLRGADLREAQLPDANFAEADLQGAILDQATLTRAKLQHCNLQAARMLGVNLCNADLRYADLLGADLRDADLTGALLDGANLAWADLRGARVAAAQLAEAAGLPNAFLHVGNASKTIKVYPGQYIDAPTGFGANTFLSFAVCSGTFERWSMEDREMFGAQFCGSFYDLSMARSQMSKARLNGEFAKVSIDHTQLAGADLSGSFSQAQFDHAVLVGARLRGTFVQTTFCNAVLEHCTVEGASFVDVDFTAACGITEQQLRSALRLRGTTFPNGQRYDGSFGLVGDLEDARNKGYDPNNPNALRSFYQ